MKGIIHKIIILIMLLSASSLAAEGNREFSDTSDAAALQKMMDDSFSFNQKFDNNFFITTNSGEDWKNITFGYTTYVYGTSHYGTDIYAESSQPGQREASGCCDKEKEQIKSNPSKSGPVTTVSWLLKITKYVNLQIKEIDGKRSVKISRGKLTQGVYSIRLEGSEFKKSLYYYKLESPLGVTTRKVFF
jgi:hypothetical protein